MIGRSLAHYLILEKLGEGGMGEVFRARDAKLQRDVAIKVLPEQFKRDPEWLARFEREARILAALNHPNIAAIYELNEAEEISFLAMELVSGETLGEKLARGPVATDVALEWFRQIAAGVETAHKISIVHRDLKPSNIKIDTEGRVRVLDFGLAKMLAPTVIDSQIETTPRETKVGVVLGTAPYMSPEQTRGGPVDARTDIWAFGCCLFETLTGTPPFLGETVPDTIAAILEREPNWKALPSSTPQAIRHLLRACLEKKPDDRLTAISEARRTIEARSTTRSGLTKWLVSGLVIALVSIGIWFTRDRSRSRLRFQNPIQISSASGVEDYPSWSPDGRMLAYAASSGSGTTGSNWDIWLTQVGSGQPVNRTADYPGADRFPVWAPDGSQIAFWSDREGGGYFVMSPLGGSPKKVLASDQPVEGARPQWSPDGSELAAVVKNATGIFVEIVRLDTRDTRQLPLPGDQRGRFDLSWSPDGRRLAYVDAYDYASTATRLAVLDTEDANLLFETDTATNKWSPVWSNDGRSLFFVSDRGGSMELWQQSMGKDGEPDGEPEALTAGMEIRSAALSSDGGRLAYSKGRRVGNLWRVESFDDRASSWRDAERLTFDHALIEAVDVSPDGSTLAFVSDRNGNADLWSMPVAGGEMQQLTTDPAGDWAPRWSPNGRVLAFQSARSGNRDVWVLPRDGRARQITTHPAQEHLPSWSPDGLEIVFSSERSGNADVWIVSLEDGEPRALTQHPGEDATAEFSPDGAWVVFRSDRSGGPRLWRVLSGGGEADRLTEGPASFPRWSLDGTSVYFLGAAERAGQIWEVTVEPRSERLVAELTSRPGSLGSYALTYDGSFLYFVWEEDLGDIWVMDVVRDD